MSDPIPPPLPPDLQFDRAVSAESGRPGGVTCSRCGRTIADSYFHLGQKAFCSSCKATIERAYGASLTPTSFVKALVFGLGAAIAGAIIYYGVIAITDFEIGIVAILIGYIVGYAIRKATGGAGARRYQILGAGLTYFAVALAYLPLAMKGVAEGRKTGAVSTHAVARDSTAASADSAAPGSAAAPAKPDAAGATVTGPASFAKGLAALILLALALPVIVVIGSMPSGLISALIIGFGIRQAWRMTAAPDLSFHGPLKVAPAPAAASPGPGIAPAE
jgi:hypothetical protein